MIDLRKETKNKPSSNMSLLHPYFHSYNKFSKFMAIGYLIHSINPINFHIQIPSNIKHKEETLYCLKTVFILQYSNPFHLAVSGLSFYHFPISEQMPVGGLKHFLFFQSYIGNVIIPTDFHIFQTGRYTTNQHGHFGRVTPPDTSRYLQIPGPTRWCHIDLPFAPTVGLAKLVNWGTTLLRIVGYCCIFLVILHPTKYPDPQLNHDFVAYKSHVNPVKNHHTIADIPIKSSFLLVKSPCESW